MSEKRFRVEKQTFDGYCIVDNHFDGYYAYEKQDLEKLCENLNDLNDENEQLKQSVNNLKETIIKITIAYQRKYDRTIVDLVDEVHDEDITDLIKELQRND